MAELRYNQLLGDYVMIASHRQSRPQMPKDYCPFCPGSGKVPDDYDVFAYDNDFPALLPKPPTPDDVDNGSLFNTSPSFGKCEVILYSKDHNKTLPDLSVEHITKLVDLLQTRIKEISKDKHIKYIMPFENKGEVVGVTIPHPHGQIYGYSWIPQRIKQKIEMMNRYYEKSGNCLLCEMLKEEIEDGRRIIFENNSFVCFLPFASEYPYGVMLLPKKHNACMLSFNEDVKKDFADALKKTTMMFDKLFDTQFPYMMCLYNEPVNSEEDFSNKWHFHVEFFPPMRSKEKQKFNASSETGANASCNPTAPEDMAKELKAAYEKI